MSVTTDTALQQLRTILEDATVTDAYLRTLLDDTNNVERAITKHFNNRSNVTTNNVPQTSHKPKPTTNKTKSRSKGIDKKQPSLNSFFNKPKINTDASIDNVSDNNAMTPTVKPERQNTHEPLKPVQRIEIVNENSKLSREISDIAAASAVKTIHNNRLHDINDDNSTPPPLEPITTPTKESRDNYIENDISMQSYATHATDTTIKSESNDMFNGNNNTVTNQTSETATTNDHFTNTNTDEQPSNIDLYYAKSPYEACWHAGEPVPYQHLSRTFAVLEHTTNRKQMLNMLTVMYWHILELTPQSLYAAVMLTSNSLGPSYENLTLGVGGAMLSTVVRSLTGISRSTMHDDWTKYGDLGLIAHKYSLSQSLITKPKPLTVEYVYKSLLQIAKTEGKDSQNRKSAIIRKLCIATTEHEITYIIRTLETELRIGAVITTVLNAIAKACVLHCYYKPITSQNQHICTYERVLQFENIIQFNSPTDKIPTKYQSVASQIINAIKQIRAVYNEFPNQRDIIACLVADPSRIHTLSEHLHLTVGVPIKPMLARITKNWNQIFDLYDKEDFTAEIKYDGQRCQIHYSNKNNIKIYSRHMLETTKQWPESLSLLHNVITDKSNTQNYIIDAEIVAVEHTTENDTGYRILPFQELTKRSRGAKKQDANNTQKLNNNNNAAVNDELTILTDAVKSNKQVQIMIIVFDILYLNDKSLMRLPLFQRRNIAIQTFTTVPGRFEFSEHMDILYTEWQSDEIVVKVSKPKQGRITNIGADIDDDVIVDNEATNDNELVSDVESGTEIDEVDNEIESATTSPTKKAKLNRDTKTVKTDTVDSDTDADRYNTDHESMTELQRIVVTKLQSFLVQQGSIRGEGLMLKSLSAVYEPDVRGDKWIKIKKDYIGGIGIADSFDCVVIGGWDGNGRKAGMISPWLLAVYNQDNNEWETLCKVMSGFSDTEYEILTKRYKTQYLLHTPPNNYNIKDGLIPQYYFDTKEVWEIRGADLTISPKHTAAIDLIVPDKGISLRFPRFIRIRNKQVTDATTNEQVAQFFKNQNISVPINKKPR